MPNNKVTTIEVGPDDMLKNIMVSKDMTRRTGILNELQAHQLRLWPIAILDAKECESIFDFDKKKIIFKIASFYENNQPDNISERIDNLDKSVKFLLGDNYSIAVKYGKRTLK